MGWSGIDSPQARSTHDLVSRTQRSASASAFTRVFDVLWAVHRRAQTQNRENNPMQSKQSKMGPGSEHSCCVAFEAREEKWSVVTAQPNLILLLAQRACCRTSQTRPTPVRPVSLCSS